MITFEDCIGLCELSDDEVAAIAEHEHIPALAAAELGNYLLHTPDGGVRISEMIRDDIEAAVTRRDVNHAAKLKMALKYFLLVHPDAPVGPTPLAA
jgi:hypothetical protein